MPIAITTPVSQTWLVIALLGLVTAVTVRKKNSLGIFPPDSTLELKGLAILFVVLSHIGYFLVNDHRFLVPLSNYAGVGVDLFLILSGFGLTISLLRHTSTITEFYQKRLSKVCIPVAITVFAFTALDALILKRIYPLTSTLQNALGIFPHADLFNDLNSPLWFVTLIIGYYLALPLLWVKRAPVVTALSLAGLGVVAIVGGYAEKIFPSFQLTWMYRLHLLAFPLGVALGHLIGLPPRPISEAAEKISSWFVKQRLALAARIILAAILLAIFIGLSRLSFVGTRWIREELLSLGAALTMIGFWLSKPFDIHALRLIGLYSFELYLLHWPLMSRYDIFYKYLPAGVATAAYLALLIGVGALFQRGTDRLASYLKVSPKNPSHS